MCPFYSSVRFGQQQLSCQFSEMRGQPSTQAQLSTMPCYLHLMQFFYLNNQKNTQKKPKLNGASVSHLSAGHQRPSSRCQFSMSEAGHTMRCGLRLASFVRSEPRKQMVWAVLPSPISSARMAPPECMADRCSTGRGEEGERRSTTPGSRWSGRSCPAPSRQPGCCAIA